MPLSPKDSVAISNVISSIQKPMRCYGVEFLRVSKDGSEVAEKLFQDGSSPLVLSTVRVRAAS